MRGTIAALCAITGALLAPAAAWSQVSVYPVPGTSTLTPRNQISFRGVPRGELGTIVVEGSRSGRHGGTLRAHSDGDGASFIPARPFRPGERVRVRRKGSVIDYRVARRPPPLALRAAELPGVGRGDVQRFRSRPDLAPPAVAITTRGEGRSPGHVFLAPKSGRGQDGPMILDDAGRLIWFKAMREREVATDFRVQLYRGKPVLTWWQGRLSGGEGRGEGVIYDDRYRPIRRVRAANGHRADLHEFQLTPNGTAFVVIYDAVRRDGRIISQAVVQEIDIETGLVVFEWHSLGNVALSETYTPRPSRRGQWDYMHVNSVALDARGDVILSSRATRAIYRISRASGRILWRLGGRRSDFKLGPGARFGLQHDARPQPDGTLTIYDNSASPPLRKHSRAITLRLDPKRRTATLENAFTHPLGLLSATQGSAQRLANGNTFVGFGSQRYFSEFDPSGRLVLDGRLARGNDSYRAYRFVWAGRPLTRPKLVTTPRAARVSWNGATGVAAWQVLAGRSANALVPVKTVTATGFETFLPLDTRQPFVAARALDAAGATLATSRAMRR